MRLLPFRPWMKTMSTNTADEASGSYSVVRPSLPPSSCVVEIDVMSLDEVSLLEETGLERDRKPVKDLLVLCGGFGVSGRSELHRQGYRNEQVDLQTPSSRSILVRI